MAGGVEIAVTEVEKVFQKFDTNGDRKICCPSWQRSCARSPALKPQRMMA